MKKYIKHHPWKIIEEGFHPNYQKVSESLFSIGNGRMGQRANFPEDYTGQTLQGNYLAGIYYPDKTRVGWWKNGYPAYFAKVLNAPNWLALCLSVDGQVIDLATWKINKFRRELDMEEGILSRNVELSNQKGVTLEIRSRRICHLVHKNLGLLEYTITILEGNPTVTLTSAIEGDVVNEDANYDEQFWENHECSFEEKIATLSTSTKKTAFKVHHAMVNVVMHQRNVMVPTQRNQLNRRIEERFDLVASAGDSISLQKYVVILSNFYYPKAQLSSLATKEIKGLLSLGFNHLVDMHKKAWSSKWAASDVMIEGDTSAQQGIRFNIFQLYQTYTGDDDRLNIGPKGFTGEKYGGSTYWDTEAYCLPFYLATAPPSIARNLLSYRHKHLDKAIENASKLGFDQGAALYPMVTMTGEECHNEWEITFEEIHRNGAIAFAIYSYIKYTGDHDYLLDGGIEVLVGIARFWIQRVHFSIPKNKYVIHGVTGPNEYENNVNNNWYTNYIAQWCLNYTVGILTDKKYDECENFLGIVARLNISEPELKKWQKVATDIFLPYDDERGIFLQQEGFLDKEILPASAIPKDQRPIHQHWSWDRILRSCYIKQADVLQGMFFLKVIFLKPVFNPISNSMSH